MNHPMRRSRQQLSQAECETVLARSTHGVLALSGDKDYPYAVPISYIFTDGIFYFHSAKTGHKLDAIRRSSKASFCVVDQDEIVPEKLTSYFRSVIAFGRIQEIGDEKEKQKALQSLAAKYAPNLAAQAIGNEIEREWKRVAVLKLEVEQISGKEAIELRPNTESRN